MVGTHQDLVTHRQRYEEYWLAMLIYVGNLDYAVTSDDLRAIFEPYGTVASAEVQVKSRTGQSRGFGLVDMPEAGEARTAIDTLNGSSHNDRSLTVNESRPRRTVRDMYAGGGWFGGGPG
jgi:RNA recognition motif-containing protein